MHYKLTLFTSKHFAKHIIYYFFLTQDTHRYLDRVTKYVRIFFNVIQLRFKRWKIVI